MTRILDVLFHIGYFQQVRRHWEIYRFWNIWRPHKSQFLCNYTGQLTSIAFYGQNESVNKLSNRLFLNVKIFPVLKKLFLLKSNGWIASCPYFQWEKIDKLFKNENFNLVRPTPVLQLVPLENTQLDERNWVLRKLANSATALLKCYKKKFRAFGAKFLSHPLQKYLHPPQNVCNSLTKWPSNDIFKKISNSKPIPCTGTTSWLTSQTLGTVENEEKYEISN
jgi:hypothetical protein